MSRFTLPRDIYFGEGSLETLKTLKGKKAVVVVGGGSMRKFGFLDKVTSYLAEANIEVKLIEGVEPEKSSQIRFTNSNLLINNTVVWTMESFFVYFSA